MLKDYENKKPLIETDRLILRDYEPEDVHALKEWLSDMELYKYWGRGPLDVELDPELLFSGQENKAGWPQGNGVIPDIRLAIYYKAVGKVIGEIQLYDCMDYKIAEVGFRLNRNYRGAGIAIEALTALVDFVFTMTELERLNAFAAVENQKSGRVLESSGFVMEGTVRRGRMVNCYCDYNIYGMLRSDWLKISNRACEVCPLGLYVWRKRYSPETLKLSRGNAVYGKHKDSFLFPESDGHLADCMNEFIDKHSGLTLERITEQQKAELERYCPSIFEFEEDKGSFDYIYSVDALADLKGKKYSKKRNHINAFMLANEGKWRTEPMTKDNLEECRKFAQVWYEKRIAGSEDEAEEGLASENEAIAMVLDAYDELMPEGLVLRLNGKCVAFTMGQKVGRDTFDIVFEKADDSVRGAYNVINREFTAHIRAVHPEIRYINRENDLNMPGLRQAKKLYRPVMMLKKYIGRIKQDTYKRSDVCVTCSDMRPFY